MTKACQCPRVYAVCSYRMPVEIHTIAIYSIYYNKLKLQAEQCLHVFYVWVVLNSAFIYKLNLLTILFGLRISIFKEAAVEFFWFLTRLLGIDLHDNWVNWYRGHGFINNSIFMEINPWKFGQKQFRSLEIHHYTNHQFSIQNCFIPMKIKLQLWDGMDGAQLIWSPLFPARFISMPFNLHISVIQFHKLLRLDTVKRLWYILA